MGQKVHPKSVRLGVIQTWDSTWYAKGKDYASNILEDHKIRVFLKKRLKAAAVSKIEIDRKAQRLIIRLITGRPGVVVGRGGQGLEQLRKDLTGLTAKKEIQVDVLEVARVDAEAQLIAESIAQQLEKRIPYRRAIKQAIQRSMRAGVKGIKIMIAGRLGGVEIARTEWSKEGRIPLHTFRADIEYGFTEAVTMFGIIGVKVWIFKGEVMPGDSVVANIKPRSGANRPEGDAEGGSRRGSDDRPRRRRPDDRSPRRAAQQPAATSEKAVAERSLDVRVVQPASASGLESSAPVVSPAVETES